MHALTGWLYSPLKQYRRTQTDDSPIQVLLQIFSRWKLRHRLGSGFQFPVWEEAEHP